MYKMNCSVEATPVKKEVEKEPKPKKSKAKKRKPKAPVMKKDTKPALPAYNDARSNGYIPSHKRAQPDERDLRILAQRVLFMLLNTHIHIFFCRQSNAHASHNASAICSCF